MKLVPTITLYLKVNGKMETVGNPMLNYKSKPPPYCRQELFSCCNSVDGDLSENIQITYNNIVSDWSGSVPT